ncbi:hypothetical protein BJ956_000508 [Arthrobacter psychrochitiniphilus]|nr:hypothetical protein [Arthrobacter psychrochitiniphilus]
MNTSLLFPLRPVPYVLGENQSDTTTSAAGPQKARGIARALRGSYVSAMAPNSVPGSYVSTTKPQPDFEGSYVSSAALRDQGVGSYVSCAPRSTK